MGGAVGWVGSQVAFEVRCVGSMGFALALMQEDCVFLGGKTEAGKKLGPTFVVVPPFCSRFFFV